MSTLSQAVSETACQPIVNAQAWYGPHMASQPNEWLHRWSADEIAEIEAAVMRVKGQAHDLMQMSKSEFQLPTISRRLESIKRYVLDGPGFYLLRGLPISRWSIEEAATAFWGLGLHLGEPCSQNGKGHVLGHVKNLGLDYQDPATRGYQTNARLPYHTDSSDVVGLLCLKTSKSGGLSSIVSSTTLYNEVLKQRPELLANLMRPFYRTRWGEVPEGKQSWAEIPVFMEHRGRIIAHYVRSAIRKGQLLEGVPVLTTEQEEALDFLDELSSDPALHLDMTFEPGDVQLVCNHSTMHSRTAYEDFEQPEDRRHLLRLWLACANGPALPDWMTQSYEGATQDGRPNGILVPGVPLHAPLAAE
ncbi:MAG: hypothetical protein ACI89J_000173 [Hyphomicrobiaceae bacterium]|jgi:hypothetical protein